MSFHIKILANSSISKLVSDFQLINKVNPDYASSICENTRFSDDYLDCGKAFFVGCNQILLAPLFQKHFIDI